MLKQNVLIWNKGMHVWVCIWVCVCNLCMPSEDQWLTLISTSWWISLWASGVSSRQRQEDVTCYRDSAGSFFEFVFAIWSW